MNIANHSQRYTTEPAESVWINNSLNKDIYTLFIKWADNSSGWARLISANEHPSPSLDTPLVCGLFLVCVIHLARWEKKAQNYCCVLMPLLRSSLTSINLAILCKADDIKRFGYSAVIESLPKYFVSLEEEELYSPSLAIRVKGTVYCVVADNLAAHSIVGFVESFSRTRLQVLSWRKIPVPSKWG